jgi:UDP-galactose transporter B1
MPPVNKKGSPRTDNASKKKPTSLMKDVGDLVMCAGGIYICYLGYGILQEKLYKTKYGAEEEKFTHSLFLVWFQCLVNGFLAFLMLAWSRPPPDTTPRILYFKIAFSYIGAMFASNAALAYVNYPTQALAKSCKMIPVMLARIVIVGKRYALREYATVVVITAGIATFMLMKESKKKGAAETSMIGLGLLFTSLALDGYTGPTQENIIKEHKPTTQQLMLWLNIAAVIMVTAVLLVTGQLFTAIDFIQRHPSIITDILVFAMLSAVGQNFILLTLFRFDSLVLTTVTTTRKFFTILASVVWFGHTLNGYQWFGVGLVFLGLGLDGQYKFQKKQNAKRLADKGQL